LRALASLEVASRSHAQCVLAVRRNQNVDEQEAFREATAFLKGFENLIAMAEQVEEAGSLENIVARLKGDAASLETTIAAKTARMCQLQTFRNPFGYAIA
jgi:hypothetical protein